MKRYTSSLVTLFILIISSYNYAGSSTPTTFNISHITQEQFNTFSKTDATIFIAFLTDWCSGCRAQHKSLASLQDTYKDKTKIFMLDWDKKDTFTIPAPAARTTIVAYKKGKKIDQLIGSNDIDRIKNFLDKNI